MKVCIPKDWKMVRVTPIFKKGPKNQAGNYRPVSLTSAPCKVMESLLRAIILKHVMENNLLSACHGEQPTVRKSAWFQEREVMHVQLAHHPGRCDRESR